MEVSFLHTKLCEMLNIRYPILQAGMGGNPIRGYVANPQLAAAVSNAGGLGVLGGAPLSVEEFAVAVKELKSLTNKPFGVNLVFPGGDAVQRGSPQELYAQVPQDYWEFTGEVLKKVKVPPPAQRAETTRIFFTREVSMAKLDILLQERVPVMVYSLGDPGAEVIDAAHSVGTTVIALAGTTRHSHKLKAEGVDAIVAVGWEAGGHSGYIGTLALVPQVVAAVAPIPVVAGGGIANGAGLLAALALGAAGVWVGTRFMTSLESGAAPWMKRQALEAIETSTSKGKFVSGKPNRHLRSPWDDAWEESVKQPLPMPLQGLVYWDYYSAVAGAGAFHLTGEPMGQGVGLIKELKPAKQIVEDMVAEAKAIYERLAPQLGFTLTPRRG